MEIKRHTTVIIPCYNESASVGFIINSYHKKGFEHVLIVDDASRDETAKIATELGAQVISHESTQGRNLSVLNGLYSINTKYALVVDANMEAREGAVESFLNFAEKGLHSVVLSASTKPLIGVFPNIQQMLKKRYGLFLPSFNSEFMFLDNQMIDLIRKNTIGTQTSVANEIVRLATANSKKIGVWAISATSYVPYGTHFSILRTAKSILHDYFYNRYAFPNTTARTVIINASFFSVVYVVLRFAEKLIFGN